MNYCMTCNKEVTNQWAIIGGKHVGCPKAKRAMNEAEQAQEDKMLETASEVMGEMLSAEERGE